MKTHEKVYIRPVMPHVEMFGLRGILNPASPGSWKCPIDRVVGSHPILHPFLLELPKCLSA